MDEQNLPTDIYDIHMYKGVPFHPRFETKEVLDKVCAMNMKPDDVIIQGYPKSGTTWLQYVVWLLQHNLQPLKSTDDGNLWDVAPLIEVKLGADVPAGIDVVEQRPSPRLYKTHLPSQFLEDKIDRSGCKCIIIIRNPKDVVVSYYHFYMLAFPHIQLEWNTFFEKFQNNALVYGSWADNVKGWWKQKEKKNCLVLIYEEMLSDTKKVFQQIADFLEVRCDDQQMEQLIQMTRFQSMKSNPKTNLADEQFIKDKKNSFYRSGTVGGWKKWLTVSQSEYLDDVVKKEADPLGIPINDSTT